MMVRNIFIALLLSGFFFSCSEEATAPEGQSVANDADLIQAIKQAPDKQPIMIEDLPAPSQNVLAQDYSESFVEEAKVARELGYEVHTRREKGTRLGERWQAYFDLNGRELRGDKDSNHEQDGDRDGKDRNECFKLVYPITFIMPDGSAITGKDEKEACTLIRSWYEANSDSKVRPVLQYPVDISFDDGTIVSVNSDEEMQALLTACTDSDRNEDVCFKLVYPVTYLMPDGSTITVENKDGYGVIKDWYNANPDSKERPALQYPVDVILEDGTTMTINTIEEMQTLIAACHDSDRDEDSDHDACFKLVYPVTYLMPDGSTITVDNKDGYMAIKDWYTANPDSKERPALQYPVDVILEDGTTMTINTIEEMQTLIAACHDSDRDEDSDHDACFKLVYPVTYLMPDGSTITVENKDGYGAIRDWYNSNPDSKERPALQYPVDIKFKDGTILTINTDDEMKQAKKDCDAKEDEDGDDHEGHRD